MGNSRIGDNRVLRGGAWNNNGRNCRSAYRNNNQPDNANNTIGFRLSRIQNAVGMSVYDQTFIQTSLRGWQKTRPPAVLVNGQQPAKSSPAGRLYPNTLYSHA